MIVKKIVLMLIPALLCMVSLISCDSVKERQKNAMDMDICLYLSSENIEKTIPIINDFLANLDKKMNEGKKLNLLTEGLKSFACVIDATIFCESCIKTLPPQSEVSVLFFEDGTIMELILDILMTEPLKASICSIEISDKNDESEYVPQYQER